MEKIIKKIHELTADIPKTANDFEKFFTIYYRLGKLIKYDHITLNRSKSLRTKELHLQCRLLRYSRSPKYRDTKYTKPDYIESLRKKYEKMHHVERKKIAGLYGGLIKGSSVCAGYALILTETLEYVGIKCKYVGNDTHAWNLVQLNNKWYCTDLTWDAQNGLSQLKYCLRSNKFFAQTHPQGSPSAKCSNDFDRETIHSALITMTKGGFFKEEPNKQNTDLEYEK